MLSLRSSAVACMYDGCSTALAAEGHIAMLSSAHIVAVYNASQFDIRGVLLLVFFFTQHDEHVS